MIAAHLLHSASQLTDPENVALLRECSHLVIAPEFPVAAAAEAAPQARILLSFNAAKLYFGDRGRNPVWNAMRAPLLERKRENGTPAFLYADGSKDPGDPTPHLGLIEPTLENAEVYARVITERYIMVRDSRPEGYRVEVYIDDAPRAVPRRLQRDGDRYQQGRWQAYLSCLLANLPGLPWVNCAGMPPDPYTGISCEYPRINAEEMARLCLSRFYGLAGDGMEASGILWGSPVGVDGLFLRGVYLR